MKKFLLIVLAVCMSGMAFAQTAGSIQEKEMNKKVEKQILEGTFRKAYDDYMNLVKDERNVSTRKAKNALLKMSSEYMQLPDSVRIELSVFYFGGQWRVGDQLVAVKKFLTDQKSILPSRKQATYAAFLNQIQADMEKLEASSVGVSPHKAVLNAQSWRMIVMPQ